MEKEMIAIVLTDTHISASNWKENRIVFNEAADIAVKNCQNHIFHIGDVFDSREAQSLKELGYFDIILQDLADKSVSLIAIPGNHDKMSYTSEESYLDVYRHHPNFEVITSYDQKNAGIGHDIKIHLVPYFKEDGCYQKYLKIAIKTIKEDEGNNGMNFLFTHCAAETVRNNDGSTVTAEAGVSLSMFDLFDFTAVGHYHDEQELPNNVFYIGSSLQHNFGESRGKGCTLIYSDKTYKTIKSNAKGYIRKELTIGKDDPKTILIALDRYKNDYKKVRIIGTKEECRAFDKSIFNDAGISVERKVLEGDVKKVSSKEFKVQTTSSIKESFKGFAIEKGLDKEKIKIAKKYINMLS